MKNQIHVDKDFGWFKGEFDNNQSHKHYALQLSIPINGPICVETENIKMETSNPILIGSNVTHKIVSNLHHFVLLINPASTIGHFWNQYLTSEIQEITIAPALELATILDESFGQQIPLSALNSTIISYDCSCHSALHKGDERISKALTYLWNNSEKIVPLNEIANHCNLSPSRFLHLFKEQTGITYRRAQLWHKISNSISQLGTGSLTEIAHFNGFADSAHFSRTFKENFGFSPREFLKNSQFIQV